MTGAASLLWRRLASVAAADRDAPALTFLDARLEARSYSYGALVDRANHIGERLRRSGAPLDAPLGILLRSQEEQVLHYLGALAAGLVPALLTPPNRKQDPAYYAATAAAVIDRSRFGALITDLEPVGFQTPVMSPDELLVQGEGPHQDPHRLPPETAFLQYSSGTTGFKRGVHVTDGAVLAQLDAYGAAIGLRASDRIVSWLPLYHDMGFVACLNLPLAHGASAVMLDPIDWVTRPGLFLRAVSQHRATLSWNPNFAYAFMADRVRDSHLSDVDLSSLRALVNCSEPVTAESQRRFAERFAPYGLRRGLFRGCYAMAETVFALTDGAERDPGYHDPVGPQGVWRPSGCDSFVSVGAALPGVALRVVDEQGADLDDRQVGELWVRSPFDFTGYVGDPEATSAAFVDGWYRTGDLGYRVGQVFYVAGRRKDTLIVAGVNLFPTDIEEHVSALPGIVPGRVVAFAVFDDRTQTDQLVVLAESVAGSDDELATKAMTVRQSLQSAFEIAGLMVELVEPGSLVKSSAGKIARSENRERFLASRRGAATLPTAVRRPR